MSRWYETPLGSNLLAAATVEAEQRSRMKPARRSFDAARIGPLMSGWASNNSAANALVQADMALLRGRARTLVSTNGLARRFVQMVGQNVVGPQGFNVRCLAFDVRPDGRQDLDRAGSKAVDYHFQQFANSVETDFHRKLTLWQMLRIAAEAAATDGDVFIRRHWDRSAPYGMRLQLIEADHCDEKLNGRRSDGTMVRMGIELDANLRRLGYWFDTEHPGDVGNTGTQKRLLVAAEDVWHIYRPLRPGQLRGVSWLRPVMGLMAMLDGFEEAAVTAARFGASSMLMFESPDGDGESIADAKDQETGELFMDFEPGSAKVLPPGYKPHEWSPDYPHQTYDPFMKSVMNRIAVGLGVATHNLTGDMTSVNYSSARIAELTERDRWMQDQDWFIGTAVMPMARDFVRTALMRKAVTLAPGKAIPAEKADKFASGMTVNGRRWTWVDPANEMKAATDAIANGITSRTRVAAERGMDVNEVLAELAFEAEEMKRLGITPAAPAPAAKPADPQPPTP